ncbi:exonuclease RecJ [Halohasta salina]|uniref:exonuclease RecJ n=1 Tax=Halohasta salina TaxID=2961621 RepID=UPI0020A39915|nr:exonuclease RecJ [Halohasta salina]
MSETHAQPVDPEAAATLATALASAPFVRVYGHADGDSLAAAGLLAVALRARSVPFQIHVSDDPTGDLSAPETEPVDDSRTVLVTQGRRDAADHAVPPADDSRPASVVAAAVSHELGVDPDPLLALAGTIAAGSLPGTDGSGGLLETAEQSGLVERRPGLAVPTAELAEGLAHSTLFSAPFSGDVDAAEGLLTDLDCPADAADADEDARMRLASAVAVETSTAEPSTPAAAEAVETALRPYATPNGPFATLGGYADVLGALAAETPGLAISLALGTPGITDEALETWRDHASGAHAALDEPTAGRYEGVFVLRVDADRPAVLPTVARLAAQFRSPEPVALAVTAEPVDGQRHAAAAAAADDPQGLADAFASVATEFGGTAGGTPTQATLSVDGDVSDGDLIAAIREALA